MRNTCNLDYLRVCHLLFPIPLPPSRGAIPCLVCPGLHHIPTQYNEKSFICLAIIGSTDDHDFVPTNRRYDFTKKHPTSTRLIDYHCYYHCYGLRLLSNDKSRRPKGRIQQARNMEGTPSERTREARNDAEMQGLCLVIYTNNLRIHTGKRKKEGRSQRRQAGRRTYSLMTPHSFFSESPLRATIYHACASFSLSCCSACISTLCLDRRPPFLSGQ